SCAMLLTSAGLLIRSLNRLLAVDPGFESDHVLTMETDLPERKYPDPPHRQAYSNARSKRFRRFPAPARLPLRRRLCATTAQKGGRHVAANWKQPCCTRDEGRPLGLGLQDQGPNHRMLLWPNGRGGER